MSQDAVADQQPATGLTEVDEALASLADLGQRPVSEHPEALAAVHEVLHQTLQTPPAATTRPVPRHPGS